MPAPIIKDSGKKFTKSMFPAIFGDFDKDGIVNIDDKHPLNKELNIRINDAISMADTFNTVLEVKNMLDKTMHAIVDDLEIASPDSAQIYARTKEPFSIFKKLVDKRLLDPKRGLNDLVGTTIAVDNYSDLVIVRDEIRSGKMGKIIEEDDFYSNPKLGYRAYHYIISYNGIPVELQLKTKAQKAVNQLSHDAYKKGSLNVEYLTFLTGLADKSDKGDKRSMTTFKKIMSSPSTKENLSKEKTSKKRRTKAEMAQAEYSSEVDAYNWYVMRLSDKEILSGYEFKDDAEEYRKDFDVDEDGKDQKEYKTVSKRYLKQNGIDIPNDKWKTMKLGGQIGVGKTVTFHKQSKVHTGQIVGELDDSNWEIHSIHPFSMNVVDKDSVIGIVAPKAHKKFFREGGEIYGTAAMIGDDFSFEKGGLVQIQKLSVGGFVFGILAGGYAGYKFGRSRPQKRGFSTEKAYLKEIKRLGLEMKNRKSSRKSTNALYVDGGKVTPNVTDDAIITADGMVLMKLSNGDYADVDMMFGKELFDDSKMTTKIGYSDGPDITYEKYDADHKLWDQERYALLRSELSKVAGDFYLLKSGGKVPKHNQSRDMAYLSKEPWEQDYKHRRKRPYKKMNAGGKVNPKAQLKFTEIMRDFGKGRLRSKTTGNVLKLKSQAVSVALSSAKEIDPNFKL